MCRCDVLQWVWYESIVAEAKGEEIDPDNELRVNELLKGVTILEQDDNKMKCRCNDCGTVFVLEG